MSSKISDIFLVHKVEERRTPTYRNKQRLERTFQIHSLAERGHTTQLRKTLRSTVRKSVSVCRIGMDAD